MKKVLNLIDDHLEEFILVLLEAAIVIIMMYQIIRRYIFNASLSWSEEFCRYCFIWFMFIGYSYSIHRKIDLRMDAVLNILPKKIRRFLIRIGMCICFALTVFLFVTSFGTVAAVIKTGEKSVGLQLPMKYVYLSAVVGFGLATFRYVERFVRYLIERKNGKEEEE